MAKLPVVPPSFPWTAELAQNPSDMLAYYKSPADITKEHLRELYKLLYPFIVAEFTHRSDNEAYMSKLIAELNLSIELFNLQLSAVMTLLETHVHPAPSTPSPTIVRLDAEITKIETQSTPEQMPSKIGESYILPEQSLPDVMLSHRNALAAAAGVINQNATNIIKALVNPTLVKPFDAGNDSIIENQDFGV